MSVMTQMKSLLATSAAAAALLSAPSALADDGDTVLVVDVSNSMWGQIEGVSKIEIARLALADYVRSLAPDTRLGVFAYGHRQEGRCDDIERVRALSRVDADAVIGQVNGLVPRGRTPLTDAVRRAAAELGDDGGTIILLTDGVETCGGDPCAMAAELAASGIELTAHVVGFDIQTPGDRAALACIAQQTGGVYLDASDGQELANAFRTASAATPRDTAEMRAIRLQATLGEGGRVLEDARFFIIDQNAGSAVADGISGSIDLTQGRYRVVAFSSEGQGVAEVEVTENEPDRITVVIAEALPEASVALNGPARAAGTARFDWTGPDGDDDYIELTAGDGTRLEAGYYAWTRDGSPAEIQLPGVSGEYAVHYVYAAGNQVLASANFTVTDADASLEAADTAPAGQTVAVTWTGPGNEDDWIGFVPVGGEAGDVLGTAYAQVRDSDDNVLSVPVPSATGDYELVYILGHDTTVMARRAIAVTSVAATIDAPDEAYAGWMIDFSFSGPGAATDWVAIVPAGADASTYLSAAWQGATDGSTASVRVPAIPGEYEVRYVQEAADDTTVLASRPLTVTEGPVSIDAPASVAAGETFTVTAEGPLGPSDYIDFAQAGTEAGDYSLGWNYVDESGSSELTAPDAPGQYTLRYVVSVDGPHVIHEIPITVQ